MSSLVRLPFTVLSRVVRALRHTLQIGWVLLAPGPGVLGLAAATATAAAWVWAATRPLPPECAQDRAAATTSAQITAAQLTAAQATADRDATALQVPGQSSGRLPSVVAAPPPAARSGHPPASVRPPDAPCDRLWLPLPPRAA